MGKEELTGVEHIGTEIVHFYQLRYPDKEKQHHCEAKQDRHRCEGPLCSLSKWGQIMSGVIKSPVILYAIHASKVRKRATQERNHVNDDRAAKNVIYMSMIREGNSDRSSVSDGGALDTRYIRELISESYP